MRVIIFGGHGFIGQHFSRYLLESGIASKIYLADIANLEPRFDISKYFRAEQIVSLSVDVTKKIDIPIRDIDLVCNFAAIHREPGHALHEYYDTNLNGAENVCKWATEVNCNRIIFTSSIAPYGPTEVAKTEASTPVPVSAYGGSKLAAEKIHQIWVSSDEISRKLVIVRPGVVFGAGERGNVTRLIKALLGRYFFYMGNKQTIKAGIYVKELCHSLHWVMSNSPHSTTVYNMSMNPGPTMKEYVNVICEVAEVDRFVPSIPFFVLFSVSLLVDPLARILGISQPISPVRLRKLVKSNNIIPEKLGRMNYVYQFTFEEAMRDWKYDAPREWGE